MALKRISLATLLIALPAFSQQIVSPEVQTDGRVTFRLHAPNAKQVVLNCEDVPKSPMQRDTDGTWSFTTQPLQPDFYAYSLDVDGLKVIDPGNPLLKYNLLNTESQVHVPGPKSLLWEVNDVPHGELHRHFYHSTVSGDDRDFIVYTPPGYEASGRKHYPVLYLLHGFSDDTSAWTAVGRANVIVDNLIARDSAKPMIIVMPLGYGSMDILNIVPKPLNDSERAAAWRKNADLFVQGLLTEVMPQVEKEYRVSKDRNMHAIAGLSMGGAESLLTGLNHPERFAWIGAFSSGGMTNYAPQFPDLNSGVNEKLRLVWIACGKDDKLLEPNERFCEWLKSVGVNYSWTETEGRHSFLVWRRNLCEFVPLLFRR